jgi:hypothetical protein
VKAGEIRLIHVITEQTWSIPKGMIEGQPLGPPRLVDSKPTREEAEILAAALSAKYHHHDYICEWDGEHGYWWGRKENGQEVYRFVVRPASALDG